MIGRILKLGGKLRVHQSRSVLLSVGPGALSCLAAAVTLAFVLLLSYSVPVKAQPGEDPTGEVGFEITPPPNIDADWARLFHRLADPVPDSTRAALSDPEQRRQWVSQQLSDEMLVLRYASDDRLRSDSVERIRILMAVWRGPEDVLMGPLFRPRELLTRRKANRQETEAETKRSEAEKKAATAVSRSDEKPLAAGPRTRNSRKKGNPADPEAAKHSRPQENPNPSPESSGKFLVALENKTDRPGESAKGGAAQGARVMSSTIQDIAPGSRDTNRPGLSPLNRMEQAQQEVSIPKVSSSYLMRNGMIIAAFALLAVIALALYRKRPGRVEREQAATKRLLAETEGKHGADLNQTGGIMAGPKSTRLSEREPVRASAKEEPKKRSPLKILLAEDNKVHQKLGLRILKRLGYEADLAKDGVEAVRAARRNHYDVVLMDVQMPRLNGIEASKDIRREAVKDRAPYIVAVTASGDREGLLAEGMDDFVAKPIRVLELHKALERALKIKRPYRAA